MDIASRRIGLCGLVFLVAAGSALPAGCGAPPATVELIGVARQALADSAALAEARHDDELARLDEWNSALDAGFDADVRLVAAGGLTGPDGQPVKLSADWVISARKGYAAARDALAGQREKRAAEHAAQLDNLAAAGEALEMATELILQHAAVGERLRNLLLSMQRRIINERSARQ